MASQSLVLLEISVVILLLITPAQCCYNAIFSFGDSLTDTGNKFYAMDGLCDCSNLPYGMTYFHKPSGRFSDGRIILDFIADAFGLPMVPPYLPSANVGDAELFRYGVNFAYGGATALDESYFIAKGINASGQEYSLGVQIREFKQLLHLLSSNGLETSHILSKSLVIVEIGGNDYMHSISENISIAELKAIAPLVMSVISSAIDTMIKLGATVIVVPGVTPFGCLEKILHKHQTNRTAEYDETGCLSWLNELAEYHNEELQNELSLIRNRNPHITIIYADYYNASMNLYQHPKEYGFEEPLIPCMKKDKVCSDPSVYVCWDGVHFTEAAYKIMARSLLEGDYAIPPLKHTCSLISSY